MITVRRHVKRRSGSINVGPWNAGQLDPAEGVASRAKVDANNIDYARFMNEVAAIMKRRLPLGMAIIMGEADPGVCRALKSTVAGISEYISWVALGPIVYVAFRKGLFEALLPLWRNLLASSPGICAGIAFSEELNDAQELLLATRLALRKAIALHDNLVSFEDGESALAVLNFHVASAMRRDLYAGGDGFDAQFQPQVTLASGKLIGAEALARWQHDGADVPPSRFIPIAEEAGLIGRIGEMMLERSARAVSSLRKNGIEIPTISVNVSPGQMFQGDFLKTALGVLCQEGLRSSDIELEITESLAGTGGDDFLRWVAELANAGFPIAIDDFGTGTSTLARLRDFPAAKIKLDRAFVAPLLHDGAGRKLCRATLLLAHSIGMTSLAEGVETRYQSRFLHSCGCHLGQGYFWGRPMLVDQLAGFWKSRTSFNNTPATLPAS